MPTGYNQLVTGYLLNYLNTVLKNMYLINIYYVHENRDEGREGEGCCKGDYRVGSGSEPEI